MPSAKRLSIFEPDDFHPRTPQTATSLRVLTKSFHKEPLSFYKIMKMTPQTSQTTPHEKQSDEISDHPLNDPLFIPENRSVSEQDTQSLFRLVMASSVNRDQHNKASVSGQDKLDINSFPVQIISSEKLKNCPRQNSFENLLMQEFYSPTKILFPENKVCSSKRKRLFGRATVPPEPQFLSGTIDVRGNRKLIETLNFSLRTLEKENSELRVKLVDHLVDELKR
jgi:hypothetical protein